MMEAPRNSSPPPSLTGPTVSRSASRSLAPPSSPSSRTPAPLHLLLTLPLALQSSPSQASPPQTQTSSALAPSCTCRASPSLQAIAVWLLPILNSPLRTLNPCSTLAMVLLQLPASPKSSTAARTTLTTRTSTRPNPTPAHWLVKDTASPAVRQLSTPALSKSPVLQSRLPPLLVPKVDLPSPLPMQLSTSQFSSVSTVHSKFILPAPRSHTVPLMARTTTKRSTTSSKPMTLRSPLSSPV